MHLTSSRSVLFGMSILLVGSVLTGFAVWRVVSRPKTPATFEPMPRRVSTGTDPSMVARDTGDI